MNVSAKTEYACIAVLELAANYGSGRPVRIGSIAATHGIPARFLVQILLQLKGAGLVNSSRGAAGGYQLIRDPARITLAEVMSVIEGQSTGLKSSAANQTPVTRTLMSVWNESADAERDRLESVTFADLLESVKSDSSHMYYI